MGWVGLLAFQVASQPCALSAQTAAQQWLAFRGTLGHEWLAGPISGPMKGAVRSEWSVLLRPPQMLGPWRLRFGVGIGRVTYDLDGGSRGHRAADVAVHNEPPNPPPYERWNHVTWHGILGLERALTPGFHVYAESRLYWGRLRSQWQVFYEGSDDPFRVTPYDEWTSTGVAAVTGFRIQIRPSLDLDLMARISQLHPYTLPSFDLTNHALGSHAGGWSYGFQIGAFWSP